MNRILLFCLFIIIAFFACDKDNDNLVIKNNCDDYCLFSTGSYWVYQHYQIDSNGIEQLLTELDTVHVLGDSTINGEIYSILVGEAKPYLSAPYNQAGAIDLVRDSLNYLVNSSGEILFSSQDFTSVLHRDTIESPGNITIAYSYNMENVIDSFSITAGTFKVINYKGNFSSSDSTYSAGYLNSFNSYYAAGVGKVSQEYLLPDKMLFVRRLYSYHIN